MDAPQAVVVLGQRSAHRSAVVEYVRQTLACRTLDADAVLDQVWHASQLADVAIDSEGKAIEVWRRSLAPALAVDEQGTLVLRTQPIVPADSPSGDPADDSDSVRCKFEQMACDLVHEWVALRADAHRPPVVACEHWPIHNRSWEFGPILCIVFADGSVRLESLWHRFNIRLRTFAPRQLEGFAEVVATNWTPCSFTGKTSGYGELLAVGASREVGCIGDDICRAIFPTWVPPTEAALGACFRPSFIKVRTLFDFLALPGASVQEFLIVFPEVSSLQVDRVLEEVRKYFIEPLAGATRSSVLPWPSTQPAKDENSPELSDKLLQADILKTQDTGAVLGFPADPVMDDLRYGVKSNGRWTERRRWLLAKLEWAQRTRFDYEIWDTLTELRAHAAESQQG